MMQRKVETSHQNKPKIFLHETSLSKKYKAEIPCKYRGFRLFLFVCNTEVIRKFFKNFSASVYIKPHFTINLLRFKNTNPRWLNSCTGIKTAEVCYHSSPIFWKRLSFLSYPENIGEQINHY